MVGASEWKIFITPSPSGSRRDDILPRSRGLARYSSSCTSCRAPQGTHTVRTVNLPRALCLPPPGHVDHPPRVEFDLLAAADHGPLAGDDVVELVGALVVVQLGVLDLDEVDLAGGTVLLLDQGRICPQVSA